MYSREKHRPQPAWSRPSQPREVSMAEDSSGRLTISLARYDGPFDVLISLIRRNEWSIDDLPVLEITRQFLAHIQAADDMDAELGGEFVETASWLVLLKSRSMLPGEANEPSIGIASW